MIARLTIILLVFATAAGARDMQPQEESEAAKKARMYQEYIQNLREGIAQLAALIGTNPPTEERLSLSNFDNSPILQDIARRRFEEIWIHSSFGLSWDTIPPPTIRGSNATVEVDRFIAENGWHMLTNDWPPLITIQECGKPIHGLPWEAIRDRTFKAATFDGILYIPLCGYMVMGSSGLAYNPETNRFRSVWEFKPIGDHWYVWRQTDDASNDRSYYEGQPPKSANQPRGAVGNQPIRSETNSTSSAAGTRRSP